MPSTATSQQEHLRVAHPAAVATVGDRLEEADQVIRNSLITCDGTDFGHWKRLDPLTKANAEKSAKTNRD
jgi:hypothetical protein